MLFAAVGTAGQRCTTLRRLMIHEDVYDEVVEALVKAYSSVSCFPAGSLPKAVLRLLVHRVWKHAPGGSEACRLSAFRFLRLSSAHLSSAQLTSPRLSR